MKKLLSFILCALICISLVACSSDEKPDSESQSTPQPETSSSQPQEQESKPEEENQSASYYLYPVKTWVDSIGTAYAQVIIEIYNDGNCNAFLDTSSIDLEDASGNLIATQSYVPAYPQVIAPGEIAHYYDEIMLDTAPEGELTIVPHLNIKKATVEQIVFPVSDLTVSADNYGFIKAQGRVENTSAEEQQLIKICVTLYNSENQAIGLLFTYANNVAAGDKVGFECSGITLPNDITTESIANYEAVAYLEQIQFDW